MSHEINYKEWLTECTEIIKQFQEQNLDSLDTITALNRLKNAIDWLINYPFDTNYDKRSILAYVVNDQKIKDLYQSILLKKELRFELEIEPPNFLAKYDKLCAAFLILQEQAYNDGLDAQLEVINYFDDLKDPNFNDYSNKILKKLEDVLASNQLQFQSSPNISTPACQKAAPGLIVEQNELEKLQSDISYYTDSLKQARVQKEFWKSLSDRNWSESQSLEKKRDSLQSKRSQLMKQKNSNLYYYLEKIYQQENKLSNLIMLFFKRRISKYIDGVKQGLKDTNTQIIELEKQIKAKKANFSSFQSMSNIYEKMKEELTEELNQAVQNLKELNASNAMKKELRQQDNPDFQSASCSTDYNLFKSKHVKFSPETNLQTSKKAHQPQTTSVTRLTMS